MSKVKPIPDGVPDVMPMLVCRGCFFIGSRTFAQAATARSNVALQKSMLADRVITEGECLPVLILERAPRGVENLDRRYGTAQPLFSQEQLHRIRELQAAALATHVANRKPPRAPDLSRSLSLLRARKRRAPNKFSRPATPRAIAEASRAIGVDIPAAWQRVLRISDGGRIDHCDLADDYSCHTISAEQMLNWRHTEADYYRKIGAPLPDSLLVVMSTEIGDSIWLDTDDKTAEGDCRVVLISHETGERDREWFSIADFLEELLTAHE